MFGNSTHCKYQVNMVSVFFIVSFVYYLCLISNCLILMKSDRDRCTQKCKSLNLFPANVRCSNLENHEFMCKSVFSSVEHHAKETCQKCILFFYEGYRTSSQKGRACVPKWCSRFGSHCPSTMEGT